MVSGLSRTLRNFKAVTKAAAQALITSNEQSAVQLVGAIKSVTPVRTGKLRNSIRMDKEGYDHLVKAGRPADTFYARWVEFGHPGAAPRPYFFNTYRLLRPTFRSRAARAVGRAVRSSVK